LKSTRGLVDKLSQLILSPHSEFFETELCLRGLVEVAEIMVSEMAKKNSLIIRDMLRKQKLKVDEIIFALTEMIESGKLSIESLLNEVSTVINFGKP
jgi:hypothetical protein